MKDFVLTCSSTCDLSKYYLREHNIYYVSFFYYLDDEKFYDDFYSEHSIESYYEEIKTKSVKTSQPDPTQYKELWIKLINQGYDILHIELSSGISGAVNSALIAKSMVLETYKDAKIYVVDSLSASTGYGLLLDKVSKYKLLGNDIENTYEYAEKLKNNINHIFLVSNLDQLIKGGRINKLAGNIAKALNIIPILHVDKDGKLSVVKKSRGISNALTDMINMSLSTITDKEKYSDTIFINNANAKDISNELFEKITNTYKEADISKENIFDIGTVIGAHAGSGTVSIFYIGDGRV